MLGIRSLLYLLIALFITIIAIYLPGTISISALDYLISIPLWFGIITILFVYMFLSAIGQIGPKFRNFCKMRKLKKKISTLESDRNHALETALSLTRGEKKAAYNHALSICGDSENLIQLQESLISETSMPENPMRRVSEYLAEGKPEKAEKLLRNLLKQQPSPELLDSFARLESSAQKRYDFLNPLLKNTSCSHNEYILGTLALSAGLYGVARTHFQKSIQLHSTMEAYGGLYRTLQALGEHQSAKHVAESGFLQGIAQGK